MANEEAGSGDTGETQMCLGWALCCESALKGCFGILLRRSCQLQSSSSACLNWTALKSGHSLAPSKLPWWFEWLVPSVARVTGWRRRHETLGRMILATSWKLLNIQKLARRIFIYLFPTAVSGTTTRHCYLESLNRESLLWLKQYRFEFVIAQYVLPTSS